MKPILRRVPGLLLLTLPLAGCISFGAEPPEQLLSLSPQQAIAGGVAQSGTAAQAVAVMLPDVTRKLATQRVPVSTGGTEIAYVKDAQWVDVPARMFRALLSETISAATNRIVLDPSQIKGEAAVQLDGDLVDFGVDADSHEAVVTFDGTLTRSGSDQVEKRRFTARVPVAQIEAAPVGQALNNAANQVAGQIAAWIGQGQPGPVPAAG